MEIDDCRVVQINFPNGGWLDESHIKPTAIDNNGDASIEDDKGRTYLVHLRYTEVSNPARSHLCGHITRKGTPCRHWVKGPGYCWQHK